MSKSKALKHYLRMTTQSTEVRIAQIDETVRFENDEAGISVHVDHLSWLGLDQPGALVVFTLVPSLADEQT